MSASSFVEVPSPWASGGSPVPAHFVSAWVRTSHRDGGTRQRAILEFQQRMEALGFVGIALVSGAWLEAAASVRGVAALAPWPPREPRTLQFRAEVAGRIDRSWLQERIGAFFAETDRLPPGEIPRIYRCDASPPCLVVDLCLGGRRAGLGVFVAEPGATPVDWLLSHPATGWVFLGLGGLLRADWYWSHWDGVVELLLSRHPHGWSSEGADRPVNAQEVTLRVSEQVRGWADDVARIFEVATVGIFLPDPDDEYVWCLGSHGTTAYAYDAGLILRKPPVASVGYGLTASWAATPAVDPRGRPVVVRSLEDRAALRERYRDLGFDDAALDEPGDQGPFLAERFTDASLLPQVQQGPWVFTAQRLPRSLSPSGRNLVVRFCGRTLHPRWSSPRERARSSSDRLARQAAVAMRIHEDVVRGFREGLERWREGVREEVLRELSGPRRLDSLCRSLAAWCSARAITLWDLHERTLRLVAWSRPGPPAPLVLDTAERLDARELRLLSAPIYPRRHEISSDGFLGWPPLEDALGGAAENVGTAPVVRDGRTVGLLRIDGAMSMFAGHIAHRSPQAGLRRHRPIATPAHVRPVIEEIVRLLAVAQRRGGASEGASEGPGWRRLLDRVASGQVSAADAERYLSDLHARAPTRAAAARLLGLHRNTFRRHLERLADQLGADVIPW